MKKIFYAIIAVLFLVGCGKKNESGVLKEVENKLNKADSYNLVGNLEMVNNESSYKYDVEVSYLKDDKFKVSLNNQINNHTQVILKNDDGVYVLTPSLNKSFKFQSEWPYNNSQSYILQVLLDEMKNDKERTFEETDENYIFTTKVNYSNNSDLVKQKIYLDKDYNFSKVEVLDESDTAKIIMTFKSIDYNKDFDKDYFTLNYNVKETNLDKTTAKIDEIIYPMYLPKNTTLTSQDRVSLPSGERGILTFKGDKPFTFIQETISVDDELTTVLSYGEPTLLCDSVASLSSNSITWISNGVEYYIVSDALSEQELTEIAVSISSIPVMK